MTPKKRLELERIAWFNGLQATDFTEDEIQSYFAWSERGEGNGGRLSILKQRQGITLGEWEQEVLQGSVPYWTILGGEENDKITPRFIVDFMKKEMFKGKDADVIERCYQQILREKSENHGV